MAATASTKTLGRLAAFLFSILLALLASWAFSPEAGAVDSPPVPTIWSDKADYAPGELVTLSGASWEAGEAVHIYVNDDQGRTWERHVDVTADENGNIVDSFNLPEWFVATYAVTATGSSGAVATTSFTDGDFRVRALAGSTPIAVTFQEKSVKAFSTTDCSASSTAWNSASFTTGTAGNGYTNVGMTISSGSATVEAPASVTAGGTTYNFSSWSADANATRHSTTGSTGCFNGLSGGQTSLTANYTAAPTAVNTTTTASSATATYGNASAALAATVSATSGTVNNGTVTFTVKKGATTIGSGTSGAVSGGSATASFPLSGVNADTYTIEAAYSGATGFNASNNSAQSPAPTLTVGKKNLTISGAVAQDKTYDASKAAGVSFAGASLVGVLSGDSVSINSGAYSAEFDTASAGNDKPVTVTGVTLSGTHAGNYTVSHPSGLKANITKKGVSVAGITAADKVYDGNRQAFLDVSGAQLNGVVQNDSVTLSTANAAGLFDTKNVGQNKDVQVSGLSISGTDAGNYSLAQPVVKAAITVKSITASFTANNKVYDGTRVATVASKSLPAAITGDDVVLDVTNVLFDTKEVGTGKTVTAELALSGADAGNYSLTSNVAQTSANIMQAILTVEPNPKTSSRQYSDPNPPFSPSYSGFVTGEGPGVLDTAPTCETTANGASAPGGYDITCSGGADGNYSFSYTKGTLTVTKEDARAEYTGSLFVSTGGATSSKATVNVAATIRDITAVVADPAYDAAAGDVRNATIKFVLRETGQSCTPAIGLVNSNDPKTGTATCNIAVDIGQADSVPYTVDMTIGGYYVGTTNPAVVTVSKVIAGMITGGGFLVNHRSMGQAAGASGQKTNFGFNVRPNKSGTGLQGNINTIVRNGGRVYQIKGNSMTSLLTKVGTATTPGTATFEGKSSIQDITNPLAPLSVDGNATLKVTMTDVGEPGSSDKIGITVWNKSGGVWFSSNWSGTNTVEQLLGGGNLVVR